MFPDDEENEYDDPIRTTGAYLGVATNNEAEYQGLILGLQLARGHGANHVTIRGDSHLVLQQVLQRWRVRTTAANHQRVRSALCQHRVLQCGLRRAEVCSVCCLMQCV